MPIDTWQKRKQPVRSRIVTISQNSGSTSTGRDPETGSEPTGAHFVEKLVMVSASKVIDSRLLTHTDFVTLSG